MPYLVQKGNTIHIPAEFLGGEKSSTITVNWSQRLSSRQQDYYICNYTVKSGGESDGVIYVQTDKLDDLKAKKIDGGDYTFRVDESFQYGQNQEQTKRFLVFHNMNNWPYQHRFVEPTITTLGAEAKKFTGPLGLSDSDDGWNPAADVVQGVDMVARNFVGDYLHSY
ncbi:hypothetical protein J4E80_008709 [Alternaria sp. BMP 0032]|nr:hypothetical protein J4E80_008709 [Alternaria sp. BMP 0032]